MVKWSTSLAVVGVKNERPRASQNVTARTHLHASLHTLSFECWCPRVFLKLFGNLTAQNLMQNAQHTKMRGDSMHLGMFLQHAIALYFFILGIAPEYSGNDRIGPLQKSPKFR